MVCIVIRIARDVILCQLLARVRKDLIRRAVFNELAEPEEGRPVRNARGLLHVVRHDHDRVTRLQLVNQLLDSLRGDGIERRGGFVHQQDFGRDRQCAGDTKTLLLAAGQRQSRVVQAIFHFVPDGRGPEAFLDAFVQLGTGPGQPVDPDAVGDVLENRLGERVRFLEHHPDPAAEGDDVGAGGVDVPPFDDDLSLDPRPGDDVVHPVQGPQERALAAAGRTDEGRHQVRRDLDGDVLERPLRTVEEIQVFDVDRDWQIRGRRLRSTCGSRQRRVGGLEKRHTSPTTLSVGDFPGISLM